MRKLRHIILAFVFSVSGLLAVAVPSAHAVNQDQGGGAACAEGRFLTFPHWYKGLQINQTSCAPIINQLNDIWKIVLNIVEMMMQIAGYAAAGFMMWGGFKYIKSQGNPQDIAGAKSTLMNAAIGLGVALSAVAVINFIGTTIK